MKFCKVKNCRFPLTHVTSEHKCGICNNKGHGQLECNNIKLIQKLEKAITLPKWMVRSLFGLLHD